MRMVMVLLLLLSHAAAAPYGPAFTGQVEGFRLAGIEPDGDPLDQVVLSTTLSPSGGMPKLHLVINSYLENFKPDTTPILPDLLHPNRTATNLGGFLNGKALITDDAGNLLYVGDFLAEAFLNNSNHAVMRLVGVKAARGGSAQLKGVFSLKKNGALAGNLSGKLTLPPAARAQVTANSGATMKSVEKIIGLVTVKPHAMMGRSTHSRSAPLHTGYGKNGQKSPSTGPAPATSPSTPSSSRRLSPITMVAGSGAIACLLAAIVLWIRQRRTGDSVPEGAE